MIWWKDNCYEYLFSFNVTEHYAVSKQMTSNLKNHSKETSKRMEILFVIMAKAKNPYTRGLNSLSLSQLQYIIVDVTE